MDCGTRLEGARGGKRFRWRRLSGLAGSGVFILLQLLAVFAATIGALCWRWVFPWPAHDPAAGTDRGPVAHRIRASGVRLCALLDCNTVLPHAGRCNRRRPSRRAAQGPGRGGNPSRLASRRRSGHRPRRDPFENRSRSRRVPGLARRAPPRPVLRHCGLRGHRVWKDLVLHVSVRATGHGMVSGHPGTPARRPGARSQGRLLPPGAPHSGTVRQGDDYVELSLDGTWCYNPLEADLDPYSLAYQVSTLLNQLFGKGKEPFWQQAYTNLVKFVILLHRITDDYVTLRDVYATAVDGDLLEQKINAAREQFAYLPEARVELDEWARHQAALPKRVWDLDECNGEMTTTADQELEKALKGRKVAFRLRDPEPVGDPQKNLKTVLTWHSHDWGRLDQRLRSSIVEGISVFLSLFDQPEVADVFCPPKSAYREQQPHRGRWALAPLEQSLESGKVIALNLPIGANPALGRAIGVMLKQDFQRAVLARIPRMAADPGRRWRDIVFICDEYQNFATAGESDPGGDEKFFSLSRQAQLVALVASQSVSSLRSVLPGESWRTLMQTFRTRVFLTLADESSCKQASELCGQTERLKEQYSISESTQAGVGLLSGRPGGGKGTFGVTKSYAPRREAVFQPSAFAQLRNAQAIVAAYDGRNPLPPTYCYLKPWYLPTELGYFEAVDQGRL